MTNQADKQGVEASEVEGSKHLNRILIVVAVGAVLWFAFFRGDSGEEALIQGATVKRGFVEITVVERGNLAAKNAASIKSEIEGRATILSMVTEGTFVEAGDIVCELDTTDEINSVVEQETSPSTATVSGLSSSRKQSRTSSSPRPSSSRRRSSSTGHVSSSRRAS